MSRKAVAQIQQLKKDKFIELYEQTKGHISDCASAVGINRGTYYNWLDSDPKFTLAIAEKEAELNDEMRAALIDKAGSGDLGAIIFYLKKRHPDFKEQKWTGARVETKDMKVEFIQHES